MNDASCRPDLTPPAPAAHPCTANSSAVAARRVEVLCPLRSLGARLLLPL